MEFPSLPCFCVNEPMSRISLSDPPPTPSSSSTSSAFSGEEEDEEEQQQLQLPLWSHLPDHLVESILAWVPLWSLFRLRSVSKRWNQILDSRSFLDTYSRVPSRDVLFIMFADHLQHRVAAAYNPALNKWHLIPLARVLSSDPPNFLILATAGGLLCLEETSWPLRSLIVSNLMTQAQRKLPPMLHMKSPYVVGMMMEPDRKSYKILVAQDGETLTSQLYDSRCDSWKVSGSLNRRVALVTGTIFLKGFLYCLTFGPMGLVAYNVEDGSWQDVQTPMPPSLICPHVTEHKGQLMMVGGVEEYGTLKSIRIWQLNLSDNQWVEMQRMPEHLFQKLFCAAAARGQFFCVGHGGLVCFNNNHSPDILMYDMTQERWWWLPPCPLNYTLKRQSVLGVQCLGFSIEPRLDVIV